MPFQLFSKIQAFCNFSIFFLKKIETQIKNIKGKIKWSKNDIKQFKKNLENTKIKYYQKKKTNKKNNQQMSKISIFRKLEIKSNK